MSWSLQTEEHSAEEIRSAIEHTQPPADLSDTQTAQVRAAKETALVLLDSGAVGNANILDAPPTARFRARLSGHASDPETSGPGDTVSVSIEQTSGAPE